MPNIEIVDPEDRWVVAASDRMTFGSGRECTVRLKDRSLSRLHCELARRGDGWWLVGTGDRPRLLINGVAVTESALKPGDRVDLGRSLLIFDAPEGSAAGGLSVGRRLRRWLTPWRIAGATMGLTALFIGGLYAAPESFEFALGGLRFRRGPTEELNRKVLWVTGVVVAVHVFLLGATTLSPRRRGRRGW